jgi:methionyl-tRNA formyltransferase
VTDERAGGSRVRTVFLGSGGFGRESLRRLAEHEDVRLVGVVTAPPRPAGRGQAVRRSVIHDEAMGLGIGPILTPERLRAPEALGSVLALDPVLVVLADYGQIVPTALLGLPHGALNLHPSLLPRHRGATPIPATILAGDAETGVTLMRMDEGLDTGPIVAQAHVSLDGHETTPALEERLAGVAADLLADQLRPWLRGELDPRPQPADGATLTRPLRREAGRLDPRRSAAELERQIRAYQPWPGTFVDTALGRLVVRGVVAETGPGGPESGAFDAEGLGVGAGDRLRLTEVQPAGGKRMSWQAFVRGRPAIVGSTVVPAG